VGLWGDFSISQRKSKTLNIKEKLFLLGKNRSKFEKSIVKNIFINSVIFTSFYSLKCYDFKGTASREFLICFLVLKTKSVLFK
jgi:hypothetical protein